MANHYHFKNGLRLAMSGVTLTEMTKDGLTNDLLKSTVPTRDRCQALLDFTNWTVPKTGELIGEWLGEMHDSVGIKPDYIGSHIVDGASNATSSANKLEWITRGERSQKIVADNCDAHKANTTADQASGTSDHVQNLNPELGTSLNKLHKTFGRVGISSKRKKIVRNVQTERGREKVVRMDQAVATRWGARHEETKSANCNQADLATAVGRMICPDGVDAALFREYNENRNLGLDRILFNEGDWNLYQQYEAGTSFKISYL